MMHLLFVVPLLALTFDLGRGQGRSQYSFLPEEFPNPQTNPRKCRAGPNPGYMCDPYGILTQHQVETLNWFLEGIADTRNPDLCPCSRYHCEHHPGPRFYRLAIALVPSLKLPRDTSGVAVKPLDQAQTFAYRLQHDLWNMSSCEEDIVILYSRDDKALVTMTGRVAGRRLDAYTRSVIHSIVGQHFAEGRINEGLLRMVYEIELVLNGYNYYRGLPLAQTASAASPLTLSPLCLAALLAAWLLWRATSRS